MHVLGSYVVKGFWKSGLEATEKFVDLKCLCFLSSVMSLSSVCALFGSNREVCNRAGCSFRSFSVLVGCTDSLVNVKG